MASTSKPAYLDASGLGTKDHWDAAYARELQNHAADPTDEGTIWFDDSNAEEKMVDFLETLELGDGSHAQPQDDPTLRIADIGTGNGHLLFALRDADWQANMVGLDYSRASIELCERIAAARAAAEGAPSAEVVDQPSEVRFEIFDILQDDAGQWSVPPFDVILDKGTFDAISLNSEPVGADGRRGCELYAERVARLMKPNTGFLVITSCNWTTEELERWFAIPQLVKHTTIKFPNFQFGGHKGQTVSALCFRRLDSNEGPPER